MSDLPRLVLAPMAGGPGTVELAVAVAEAGGLATLAAGYLTADRLAQDVAALRSRTTSPFAVNLFVPGPDRPELLDRAREHAARLAPMAELAGVALGEPRYDDDAYAAKLDVLLLTPPAVATFAFGWPDLSVVEALHRAGSQVWVTLNDPAEVQWATELGVDGVVAQGWEAGAHRGGPVDNRAGLPTRDLVTAVRTLRSGRMWIVAAGGAMTAADAAALRDRGADAVAFGSAFLLADEAGTSEVHRHALRERTGTVVTRTFTGRSARALRTAWTDLHSDGAPAAYPHVHHVTAPLRAHGRATGQAELVNLWAGTGHAQARSAPAAEIAVGLLPGLGQC